MTKRVTFYDYNNKEVSTYDNTTYPDIITFTDQKANTYNDDMILYVDYHKYHPSIMDIHMFHHGMYPEIILTVIQEAATALEKS